MIELNKQLREELEEYSSKDLIRKSGIYPAQVSKWRAGSDFKTIPLLNKLAGIIGKSVYFDGSNEYIEYRIMNVLLFETQNLSTYNLSLMTGMHKNTFTNMRLGKVPLLTTMLLLADKLKIDIKLEIK